jgi:RNA polymerase sigma-70 factor, ECF subfamily
VPISLESGLSISQNFTSIPPGEDGSQPSLRQFAQFVREHEASIFTYVLRMVASREDAEDITQDALMQAYRTWSQVDPEAAGGYVKWCYRIAHNLAIDTLRKKKPRGAEEDEMEHAADERSLRPEEVYENRVQAVQIKECIQSLEEKYREVLILRYQEELSYEQIAVALDLPVSTIETRIFRAKKMLREKLEKRS